MTYNVFGGTLNLAQPNPTLGGRCVGRAISDVCDFVCLCVCVCVSVCACSRSERRTA